MKQDILGRKEIDDLMKRFYEQAFADDTIGFYFTEISKLNLSKHLPVIGSFWEMVLFSSGDYKGNPMDAHIYLNNLSPFRAEHFDRWVELFTQTVDEMFEGETAEKIKQRAASIATVMKIKFVYGEQNIQKKS